jgi:hypothetical protein
MTPADPCGESCIYGNYDTDPLGYLAEAEVRLELIKALRVDAEQALATLKAQRAPKPSLWRRMLGDHR